MNILDQAKKHALWAIGAVAAATAGATWAVLHALLVEPRDFEIARLTRALDDRARIGSPSIAVTDSGDGAGVVWLVPAGGATYWVQRRKPTILLQGQLMVEPIDMYPGLNMASIKTHIGSVEELVSDVPRGTRRAFTVGGHSYYLTVVEFNSESLALRFDRRLAP